MSIELNSIIDEQDKVLYQESIKCKEANCLRSSYIIFWICIAESLKRKIEFLNNLGDKNAEIKWESIEKQEKEFKSVDKLLIEYSRDLNIISETQFQLLNHYWSRRCLFAHPYNTEPSLKELTAFIEAGLENVLTKEIQLGKESISSWIYDLANIPHLLPNDDLRIREFLISYLIRIKENLHIFTFKTLFYNYSLLYDKDKTSIYTHRFELCLKIFTEIFPYIFQTDETGIIDHLTKYPEKTLMSYINPIVVEKMTSRAKELLEEYILTILPNQALLNFSILTKIRDLLCTNSLSNLKREEIKKIIETLDFQYAVLLKCNEIQQIDLIEKEIDSGDFNKQEVIIHYLKNPNGTKLIENLEDSRKITLGQKIALAAAWNSWATQEYLYQLSIKIELQPLSYLAGIIRGIFFRQGDFRWDQTTYKYVKPLILKLEVDKLKLIFNIIQRNKEDKKYNEEDKKLYIQEIESNYLINELRSIGNDKYDLIIEFLNNSL